MLLAGSLSFIGVGVMGSILPLLFPERGAQMTHVIIAVLLLVSGVYYPIDVLPPLLQKLAVFSPATYVLDGTRQAFLEGTPTRRALALHLADLADGGGRHPGRPVGVRPGRALCQAHREAAPQWMRRKGGRHHDHHRSAG